jgi:hypothetical protein
MNPFEAYADVAKPQWQRTQERSVEKRRETISARKTQLEEKLDERDLLAKLYRQHVAEKKQALLDGPLGKEIKGLLSFMRTMTPSSAPALVKLVEGAAWLRGADADTRHGVLSLINRGIANLRKREGLMPFDDALPGEPLTASEQIKLLLEVR